MKPKYGLHHEPRPYKCLVCGHQQSITTNHTGTCFDNCRGCTWKSFGFDTGENTMNYGGRAYRRFEYVAPPRPASPKTKKYAIRTSTGQIINQRDTITDDLRLYLQMNPHSSLVMRSRGKGNRKGWLKIDLTK